MRSIKTKKGIIMSLEVDPTKSSNPPDKNPKGKPNTSEKKPAENIHTAAKKSKTGGTKTASQKPVAQVKAQPAGHVPEPVSNEPVTTYSYSGGVTIITDPNGNRHVDGKPGDTYPNDARKGYYYNYSEQSSRDGMTVISSYSGYMPSQYEVNCDSLKSGGFTRSNNVLSFNNNTKFKLEQDNHTATVNIEGMSTPYVNKELYDLTAEHQDLEVVQGAKLGKAVNQECDDEGTLVETFKNGATRKTSSDGKTITITYADGSMKIEYKEKSGWYDLNGTEVYLDNKKMTVMYDTEGNTIYREVK